MTLKSKVAKAAIHTTSLRATIPQGCVEFLALKEKDELLWEMEDWTLPNSTEKMRVLVVRKSAD
jgi:hypothetical protein